MTPTAFSRWRLSSSQWGLLGTPASRGAARARAAGCSVWRVRHHGRLGLPPLLGGGLSQGLTPSPSGPDATPPSPQGLTAYHDISLDKCYVIELNTTIVLPPRNFWELLMNVKVRGSLGRILSRPQPTPQQPCRERPGPQAQDAGHRAVQASVLGTAGSAWGR